MRAGHKAGGTAASDAPLKVLHAAAELFPLVKTGGLADVVAALPPALARAGADVRLLLPGLPAIVEPSCSTTRASAKDPSSRPEPWCPKAW